MHRGPGGERPSSIAVRGGRGVYGTPVRGPRRDWPAPTREPRVLSTRGLVRPARLAATGLAPAEVEVVKRLAKPARGELGLRGGHLEGHLAALSAKSRSACTAVSEY